MKLLFRRSAWARILDSCFPPVEQRDAPVERHSYERFAIPYSLKPQLSVFEAVIAAVAAFTRIFFGSLLFAVWGTYSLQALSRISGLFWRAAALLPLLLAFLISLTLMLLAISAITRMLLPKNR